MEKFGLKWSKFCSQFLGTTGQLWEFIPTGKLKPFVPVFNSQLCFTIKNPVP